MVELPGDAGGREIPLHADAPCDKDGERPPTHERGYFPKIKAIKWRVRFPIDGSGARYRQDECCPTPPGSREKLEEDLRRASERDAVVSRRRYPTAGKCANRPIHGNASGRLRKEGFAFGGILDRIRKLREDG